MTLPFEPHELEFRPFSEKCPRGAFSCGDDLVNRWFHEKCHEHHLSRCRVTTIHAPGFDELVAFYALSFEVHTLNRKLLPDFFGREKFPALHLQWLAVHKDLQDKGLGTIIMGRVLSEFAKIVEMACVPALTLKPVNDEVAEFYRKIGFVTFQPKVVGGSMLLPASDVFSFDQPAPAAA